MMMLYFKLGKPTRWLFIKLLSMKCERPLTLSLALVSAFSPLASAGLFDHSLYNAILRHYVDEKGYVDYNSIQLNGMTALESYFERLAAADLSGWTVPERAAFWINAYNARVIYLLAQTPKLKKVAEGSDIFDHPFKVAGQMLTLHDIKDRILRAKRNEKNGRGPILGLSLEKIDPRIHFALVNGTLGSPSLRNTAYTAENLGLFLEFAAAAFVNSSKGVSAYDGHLELSRIFQWYRADFESVGGVRAYVMKHLDPEKRGDAPEIMKLLEGESRQTSYRYDWTVNNRMYAREIRPHYEPNPAKIPADAFTTSNHELNETK